MVRDATVARSLWIVCCFLIALDAAGQGTPTQIEAPEWLNMEGKALFNEIESDENQYGKLACKNREKLVKHMKTEKADEYRARLFLTLGMCYLKSGDYLRAGLRFDAVISELKSDEEKLLKETDKAHIVLLKQASDFMTKFELTTAGVALRRAREMMHRLLVKSMKGMHKEMSKRQQNAPPLEVMLADISGYGKTGQVLPKLAKRLPGLGNELASHEVMDDAIDDLDHILVEVVPTQEHKRDRLGVSKSTSKSGGLLYVRVLIADPILSGQGLASAQAFIDNGVTKALKTEAADAQKPVVLVKRAQLGQVCKDAKGFEKLCEALWKVEDVRSNGFGETRLLILKEGEEQQLGLCTTNANLGVLLVAKVGATVSVAGEKKDLQPDAPIFVDFCQQVTVSAGIGMPVLFAQVWHPEFAAVERTTELRARQKHFGLTEDATKAATEVVNKHAKKAWENNAKQWRAISPVVRQIRDYLKDAKSSGAQKSDL